MPDVVEKVRIEADGSQAKREAGDVENRLGKMFDRSALKAAAFNQALALGGRALGAIVAQFKMGMQAALEYERTTKQLEFTLEQLGHTGTRVRDVIQAQASEIERLTGVSDEQIRRFQIMALNSGVTTDRLDGLMKAAVRLSNAYGMSLESATRNLIKTTSGLTGELGEAVPWIRDLSKEQLRAGDAIELVNNKLEAQLEVLTTGRAGAMMGLSTAMANFGESLADAYTDGRGLNEVLNGMSAALNDMAIIFTQGGLTEGLLTMIDAILLGNVGRAGERADELRRQQELAASRRSPGLGLVDVVTGQAVGGPTPAPGAKRGGRGGGPQVEMSLDAAEGMVWTGTAFTTEENLRAAIELRQSIDAEAADMQQQFAQSQLDYQIGISDMIIADQERVAAEKMRLAEQAAQEIGKNVAQFGGIALGSFNRFMQDIIEGSKYAGESFAANMLSGVGSAIQGKGLAALAEAAILAATPWSAALAPGLAATGAAAVALGTTLMAGGMVISHGVAQKERADAKAEMTAGGGGGGGAGAFVGGGGGSMGDAFGGRGDVDRSITIVLEGPVYDGAQAGRAIAEKMAEAKQQGLI